MSAPVAMGSGNQPVTMAGACMLWLQQRPMQMN